MTESQIFKCTIPGDELMEVIVIINDQEFRESSFPPSSANDNMEEKGIIYMCTRLRPVNKMRFLTLYS